MQSDLKVEKEKITINSKQRKSCLESEYLLKNQIMQKDQEIMDFKFEIDRLQKWKPIKEELENDENENELPNYSVNFNFKKYFRKQLKTFKTKIKIKLKLLKRSYYGIIKLKLKKNLNLMKN